jgi:hypothetical protein
MLLLREKEISIHGQTTKLYSLDGKLWFSKPSDLTQFRTRRAEELRWLRWRFASRLALPVAATDHDFWGR